MTILQSFQIIVSCDDPKHREPSFLARVLRIKVEHGFEGGALAEALANARLAGWRIGYRRKSKGGGAVIRCKACVEARGIPRKTSLDGRLADGIVVVDGVEATEPLSVGPFVPIPAGPLSSVPDLSGPSRLLPAELAPPKTFVEHKPHELCDARGHHLVEKCGLFRDGRLRADAISPEITDITTGAPDYRVVSIPGFLGLDGYVATDDPIPDDIDPDREAAEDAARDARAGLTGPDRDVGAYFGDDVNPESRDR